MRACGRGAIGVDRCGGSCAAERRIRRRCRHRRALPGYVEGSTVDSDRRCADCCSLNTPVSSVLVLTPPLPPIRATSRGTVVTRWVAGEAGSLTKSRRAVSRKRRQC